MDKSKLKLPSNLLLTGLLSSGLTITLSLIYITLCIVALVLRYKCDAGSVMSISGSSYFLNTMYRYYFLDDSCEYSQSLTNIMDKNSVFVLIIITLTASILCLITAIILIIALKTYEAGYINLAAYAYIGIYVASLVIDLTFAVHFGMDYSDLSRRLNMSSAGLGMNYLTDVLRLGALLLMTISLKGFVAHIIQIILIILLIVYIVNYQKLLRDEDHSIHKMGVLDAYGLQPRETDLAFTRSSYLNNGFKNDEDNHRIPISEHPMSEYSNSRAYDRSDSWHHSKSVAGQSSRPFSYLEETRRPAPLKRPASPAMESQWPRDNWPPPPAVPVPDYSPQPARRLKSALKPAYMNM